MAATRRLAAIMFTDMVGFSAAAQSDESAALKLLSEQERLVRPLLKVHEGREIKSTGDGFLVEFGSALHAVQCAIDIHQHLQERNSQPGCTPIQLRIGVHLGDVEERGSDIFGDSVNLAARIEPLADPGGICISEPVFGQVRSKIPNPMEKLEPRALKNIRFPLEIYRVVLPWTVREPSFASPGSTGVAVLPFTNISPDPKDEYFSDGLTEELITVLAQLKDLRVIARTSVMPYKTTSKGVAQIGADLGVSFLLEGSVRKAGNRLRVTVQFIDVNTQGHVWAKSYDRELDDVFAVQTDIARQVAEALKIGLHAAEEARIGPRPPVRSESYLAYLKGRTLLHDFSQAAMEGARAQFKLAISLDPTNAAAHAGLADAVRSRGLWEEMAPGAPWDIESRRLVARAIELDPTLPEAHASLGLMHWDDWDWAAAEKEFRLAVSFNPSYSLAHNWFGKVLEDMGRAEEALSEYALAEGADPLWPVNLASMARLLAWLGREEPSLLRLQKLAELIPDSNLYYDTLSFYHYARSDLPGAIQDIQRSRKLASDPILELVYGALAHALAGETEQARAIMQRIEASPEGQLYTVIAWAYAHIGDLDACFRWLEKGLKHRLLGIGSFRLFPGVENVRSDPRFEELLRKMGLD